MSPRPGFPREIRFVVHLYTWTQALTAELEPRLNTGLEGLREYLAG